MENQNNFYTTTLYSTEYIKEKILEVAKKIKSSYTKDDKLVCVCVLKGAFMFFSDLMKQLDLYTLPEFIKVKSYTGDQYSGHIDIEFDSTEDDLSDKHLLLVEDIVDSGRTLSYLREYFQKKNPKSIKIATLLDKPEARQATIQPNFSAITLQGKPFVVGYGLDYNQLLRDIDEIRILHFR